MAWSKWKNVKTAWMPILRMGPIGLQIGLVLSIVASPERAQAQECQNTPEGRICHVVQEIRAGVAVPIDVQRQLGLITVSGGCSGTLLNRFWVLTARHCVTAPNPTTGAATIVGPLLQPNQVQVTAAWAPDRVGLATRIVDFGVNTAPGSAQNRDIALFYLGGADLGAVDSQRIYAVARDQGNGSVVLSGRLTTSDTVTQYGRGLSTFATGVFGGVPPAVAGGGLGTYRSAPLTPSSIDEIRYTLAMNSAGQVGHGGDSGGPTVVTVNGVGVGIAGVQSTCSATYVPNAPTPPTPPSTPPALPSWIWATAISACQYVSTEPFWNEIRNFTSESPFVGATLYQRHGDGRIWKYDGLGQCTATACPGWTEIDHNPASKDIVAARGTLAQRHADGRIWKYDGKGQCTAAACPGWTEIDHNPSTASIAGGNNGLYQRHADGKVWEYDGVGQCTATACPGWLQIDHNPATKEIVAARGTLFQRHADGRIWKYDSVGQCTAAACPGWTEIDHNPRTAVIAGSADGFYQRHADGRIWKYDGVGQCTAAACPGWTEIDHNSRTADIVPSGNALFQRHVDGKVWKYDGEGRCTASACPGWTEIDHNSATVRIASSGRTLYQQHADGRVWKYDGTGQCTASACPGWTEIDHNSATKEIVAVELF